MHVLQPFPVQCQRFSGDVHRPDAAAGREASTDADVGVGLAKIHREQLRVAVGEMQQADVAETRRIVERLCNLGARGVKRDSASGRSRQRSQKLPPIH